MDYGTFEGAVDWRIHKFSEFPDAVQAHKDDFAGKTEKVIGVPVSTEAWV